MNHQKGSLRMSSVFYTIILIWFSSRATLSQETKGQKAHFSLKDTPGSFSVHATKIIAKVSAKADSVNVVVKPGMAEYPLLKQSPTIKPLVHVMLPAMVGQQGGWNSFNYIGRKRSKIINKNTDIPKKNRKSSGAPELQNLPSVSRPKGTHSKRNANEVSTMNRSTKDVFDGSSGLKKDHYSNAKLSDKRSVSERKMTFSGGTGKLSVHVDLNETKVTSSTGEIKVFIKNPWRTA